MANGDLSITVTLELPTAVAGPPTSGQAAPRPTTGTAAPRPSGTSA